MARLIHLNGPPGIGKSSVAALFIDHNPGALTLDVDALHYFVGGWQDEDTDTWPVVWSLARAMAATHLDGGYDVILPAFFATVSEVETFEDLASRHGASFREVVLLDDRRAAIERFNARARDSHDPWIRHHHRLMQLRGGDVTLGQMYDDMLDVVRLRRNAVIVRSQWGGAERSYQLVAEALGQPASL